MAPGINLFSLSPLPLPLPLSLPPIFGLDSLSLLELLISSKKYILTDTVKILAEGPAEEAGGDRGIHMAREVFYIPGRDSHSLCLSSR